MFLFTSRHETVPSPLPSCEHISTFDSVVRPGDCVSTLPTEGVFTEQLVLPLEIGTNHFFRVVATFDRDLDTDPSEATSNAALVCYPGNEKVATDAEGKF